MAWSNTAEQELAGLVAASDWPALIRRALVVPNSDDVARLAWSVMERTQFRDPEQLPWLGWYIQESATSFPQPRFVDCWSADETMTLQILPLIFQSHSLLQRDFYDSIGEPEFEGIVQAVNGLLDCGASLEDSFLLRYAEIVKACVAAASGDFEASLATLLSVELRLREQEASCPILTSRMLSSTSGIGRSIADEASELAVKAHESGEPRGFEIAAAVFPLALSAWTTFSLPDNKEHERVWTRIALNYANFMTTLGESDEAIILYNRVVLMRRKFVHDHKLPWRYELGNALRSYAATLLDSAKFADSLARANEGIEIVEPLYGDDPQKHTDLLGGLLTNRCRTLLATGDAQKALLDAETAVDIRRRDFDHRKTYGERTLVLSMGLNVGCLSALGESQAAEELLHEASCLLESDSTFSLFERDKALVSLNLEAAQLCEHAGQLELALGHSLKAHDHSCLMVEAGLPETDRYVIGVVAAVGRRALAAARDDQDCPRLKFAKEMLMQVIGLTEASRAATENKLAVQGLEYLYSDVHDLLIETCWRSRKDSSVTEDVLAISEFGRMRSLGEVIDLQYDSLDGLVPDDLLAELRAVRSDLNLVNDKLHCSDGVFEDIRAKHSSSRESDTALMQIQAAGMEMFQLERVRFEKWLLELFEKVKGFVPDFDPTAPETLSIADVRALIPSESSVVLHFHVADRISIATVITHQTAEVIELKGGERTKLRDLSKAWVKAYAASHNPKGELDHFKWRIAMQPILSELRQLILEPVLERIKGGIDQLVIIPHRELHNFPLHLCRGRETPLLADEYAIRYAPSLLIMRRCNRRKRDSPTRLSTSEIPAAADLPFAELEIGSLKKQFGDLGTVSRSRADLLGAAADIDIFHHAGHGRHDLENPLSSALELSARDNRQEVLTVRDLLENIRFPKGTLAVLATCEGGIVQADDVDEHFGFPTAFLVAGMKASITALWNAGDLPTYFLMHRFYHFLRQGCPASESLANAQAWLRGKQDCEGQSLSDGAAVIDYVTQHNLFEGIQSVKDCEEMMEEWEETDTPPFESPANWGAFIMSGVDC